MNNKIVRVGIKFNDEIESIKDKRLEIKKDKSRKSTEKLTNLIIKHNYWGKVKEDMINKEMEDNNER